MKEKNIILILGAGGMMGVFTAGVLNTLNKVHRKKIHSVYGTSTGAAVGVYFISDQLEIPYCFFKNYLTRKDFIRNNLLSYLFKVFFIKNKSDSKIKDFINIDFVVRTAKNGECGIDIQKFKESQIPLYVKVIEINSLSSKYLSTEKNIFEKLKASSQTGPFSSSGVKIGKNIYIDGGTIPTEIDLDLIKKNPDKIIIYIESSYSSLFSKLILYPFHVLAGFAIMKLYNKQLGKKYIKDLFKDPNKELKQYDNVIHVKNKLNYSAFCTNKNKLKKVYEHGIEEGYNLLRILTKK